MGDLRHTNHQHCDALFSELRQAERGVSCYSSRPVGNMEHDTLIAINRRIRDAARQTAGSLSVAMIERFLRVGEETWNGAGSGQFTRAQVEEDGAYSKCAKAGLRILFDLLADLLPPEDKTIPPVTPEVIAQRLQPMIGGVVQPDWQATAFHELAQRIFVLNFQGAKAALEAELATGWLSGAWQVLWICFEGHGLKSPAGTETECDGLSTGQIAHVRWSSYATKDPYSDVIVHEAAHLLHYLKPEHYGLHVRRGQERLVDVEFRHRELFAYACEAYARVILQGDCKSRVAFADKMPEEAFSFPKDYRMEVADLVLAAARARNGWRVIREATVIRSVRRQATPAKNSAYGNI
jgi:hypothetical protein